MGNNLLRVTGMVSGMDTESIISMYSSKAKSKLEKARKSKQLNTYTQDAWKGLNSKIYSFYSKSLSAGRLSGTYKKQKATSSSSALTVTAGTTAPNGAQEAEIVQMAKSAFLTGEKVTKDTDPKLGAGDSLTEKLGVEAGSQFSFTSGSKTVKIQVGGESSEEGVKVVNSMNDLTAVLKDAGVNANFDEGNQRLFISAKESGANNDFSFTALNDDGTEALKSLGISTGKKDAGENAKLKLNGVEFESNSNSFNINGSTYTINHMPATDGEKIAINTTTDYSGVYDAVKGLLKEYNELVNEMSKLYNADSAKDYEPLTDEQKEAMTDKEIEAWEDKIKGAILRKDSSLGDVLTAMTDEMSGGIEIGGKTLHLSTFGISTAGYFTADKNERYALHIDGNADDDLTNGNEDKLRASIESDPENVMKFFQELSSKVYDRLYKQMSSNKSLSSIYKVYNDKQLTKEATEWDTKISELEQKVTDIEDKWYSRFAKMETKLAKLQKNQTAVQGFFS